jgi:biopolymer transport protein ExbD
MAKKRKEEAAPNLNMTPMIDIVFNLVIFFLIVTDLTQKELENLTLPLASKAKEDKGIEEERVIINIVEDWKDGPDGRKIRIPGKYVAVVKKKKRSHAELKKYLQTKADNTREADGMGGSSIFVLIRADRSTPWKQVQWIMQDCADPDVKIYKLQFATRDKAKG